MPKVVKMLNHPKTDSGIKSAMQWRVFCKHVFLNDFDVHGHPMCTLRQKRAAAFRVVHAHERRGRQDRGERDQVSAAGATNLQNPSPTGCYVVSPSNPRVS